MSDAAMTTAETLIRWKMADQNIKRLPARDEVAAEAGLAPGSLKRLFDGTLKDTSKVGHRLDKLLIARAERHIRAAEHQLALARARVGSADTADTRRVAALVEELRREMGKSS